MSIVNYLINMNINGTEISGGFAVDYSESPIVVVGISISTSTGLTFNDASLFNVYEAADNTFQISGNDSADFDDQNYLAIGYSDANQDGVTISIGPEPSSLTDSGTYSGTSATIDATQSLYCFLLGTRIETTMGTIAVEQLNIGDKVLSYGGREVAVKWIGRQQTHGAFAAMMGGLPICISAGAFGNDLPVRDLFVSPDHAMYLDDCVLVHAKALVNGVTIFQVTEWTGDVKYFHIETEKHEIIFAEGTPTETFIDNVSRKAFYNHAEYEALYPDAKPMEELDIPRVKYARQVPRKMLAQLAFYSEVKMRA